MLPSRLLAAGLLVGTLVALWPSFADAQYKNGQIGFEGGYMYLGEDSLLDSQGFVLGLRGGYKASDRWWFTSRAALSFRGERGVSTKTVVLLHLVPIDARYYFGTDKVRPFVGVTNSLQLLFNQTIPTSALWGPGATAGLEIRLQRDIFLGFQLDAFWMFVFEGPDTPLLTATSPLLFFL